MSNFSYMIISLRNTDTGKEYRFRVQDVNVEALYGEEYQADISNKWSELLDQVEMEYGILENDGDDENIILSMSDVRTQDFLDIAHELLGFWKRQGYNTMEIEGFET